MWFFHKYSEKLDINHGASICRTRIQGTQWTVPEFQLAGLCYGMGIIRLWLVDHLDYSERFIWRHWNLFGIIDFSSRCLFHQMMNFSREIVDSKFLLMFTNNRNNVSKIMLIFFLYVPPKSPFFFSKLHTISPWVETTLQSAKAVRKIPNFVCSHCRSVFF